MEYKVSDPQSNAAKKYYSRNRRASDRHCSNSIKVQPDASIVVKSVAGFRTVFPLVVDIKEASQFTGRLTFRHHKKKKHHMKLTR